MRHTLLTSLRALVVFTLLTGVVYPLAVTGLAQMVFPREANGSLIERDGRVVGSDLIGQSFESPGNFWGRLSATTPAPYTAYDAKTAAGSTGSNYGPRNPALLDAAKARIDRLRAEDPKNTAPVPVDLVTASASGLDPHISPAAAEYQVPRVARTRGLSEEAVRRLVLAYTEDRTAGFLGEPRVNVLRLNLALGDLRQP